MNWSFLGQMQSVCAPQRPHVRRYNLKHGEECAGKGAKAVWIGGTVESAGQHGIDGHRDAQNQHRVHNCTSTRHTRMRTRKHTHTKHQEDVRSG